MIFPCCNQLDCVRKLVAGSRINGAETNYLVHHYITSYHFDHKCGVGEKINEPD